MKLCFSTVGCPGWTWPEIVAAASDLGYDGIEPRGIGEDLFLPEAKPFAPEQLDKTRAGLLAAGLSIPCLGSDLVLCDPARDVRAGLTSYLALAQGLGAPTIRVLGDAWGEPGPDVDAGLVRERLQALAPQAAAAGITLLVETNGHFADSTVLRRLLDEVHSPAVAALWDINHPVRNFGEPAEKTWETLGGYIRHVHLKDSRMENGKLAYKMLGYGDLPVPQALRLLKRDGFEGYLSLEWVKRWNMELEDAGIVFAHFVYQARKMWAEA